MNRIFLSSTFTLNMLEDLNCKLESEICTWEEIKDIVNDLNNHGDGKTAIIDDTQFINGFGHESTADLVRNLQGIDIITNRISLSVPKESLIYVIQYIGERLPEGATELPEGAELVPIRVYVR